MRLSHDWQPIVRARVRVEAEGDDKRLGRSIQPGVITSAKNRTKCIPLTTDAESVGLRYPRAYE
jgi:hypothetical protein